MTDGPPVSGPGADGAPAPPSAGAAASLTVSPSLAVAPLDGVPAGEPAPAGAASPTLRADAWRTIRRRPDTIAAGLVLAFFGVVVLFPTLFTSQDPQHCLIGESKLHPGW